MPNVKKLDPHVEKALELYLDEDGPCYFEPHKAVELAGVPERRRQEAVLEMVTHPLAVQRVEAVLVDKGLSLHRTVARILNISRYGDTDATRLSALRLILKEDLFLVSRDAAAELWRKRKAGFKALLAKASKAVEQPMPPPPTPAKTEEPEAPPDEEVAERLEFESEGSPEDLFPVPDEAPNLGVTKPQTAAEF